MADSDRKKKNEIPAADGPESFEQAVEALHAIVEAIEQGEISLEDSIDQYARGMKLIGYCREVLARAEKRIETISGAADDAPAAEA